MCGLVGAFRADDARYKNISGFMTQGLFLSALRGTGGTGIGLVDSGFDTILSKSYVSSPVFLQTEEWSHVDGLLDRSRVIMGHTRASTISNSVASKNSHPFSYEDENNGIMLTHNGHINNYHSLTDSPFTHQVDSAHVAYGMLKKGAKATLEKAQGFYVFIWYDASEETLNIARNGHRELCYVYGEDNKTIYYASEAPMLHLLLERNGIKHGDYLEVDPYTIHSWDLNLKTLAAPKLEKYEEKKSLPVYGGSSGHDFGYGSHDGRSNTPFIPGLPKKGDTIWVAFSAGENDLNLYKELSEQDDPANTASAYGWIHGTRRMDPGSLVKINGLGYDDWKTRWYKLGDGSLPCILDKVEKDHGQDGKKYNYYECHIKRDMAVVEVQNIEAKQKRLLAQAKTRSVDSTVRSLPGPTTPGKGGTPAVGGGGRDGDVLGPSLNSGLQTDYDIEDVPFSFEERIMEAARTPVYVPGPNNREITTARYKEFTATGCFFCAGKFSMSDAGKIGWYPHPKQPEDRSADDIEWQGICPVCVGDEQLMSMIAAA